MVLVDTSVWVSHLRDGNAELTSLLNNGQVMCHPFIIGELACSNIKNRSEVLSLLKLLPLTTQVDHEEVLHFIEHNKLMGKGLGYVDMHLSSSARLTGVPIWTLDNSLDEINRKPDLSYGLGPGDDSI